MHGWFVDEKPSSDQRRVRMPELTEKMLSTARSSAIHFLKLSAYIILVELLSEKVRMLTLLVLWNCRVWHKTIRTLGTLDMYANSLEFFM